MCVVGNIGILIYDYFIPINYADKKFQQRICLDLKISQSDTV